LKSLASSAQYIELNSPQTITSPCTMAWVRTSLYLLGKEWKLRLHLSTAFIFSWEKMCQPSSCHTQSNLYFFFLIYKPVKNHHQGKKVTNEFTWGCSPLEDESMEKSLSSEYFCKEGCLFPIQNRHVTRASTYEITTWIWGKRECFQPTGIGTLY